MPSVRRRRRTKRYSTVAPAELGSAQSAFCCSSIHSSARALTFAGRGSRDSIGGPMRMVTVPGALQKGVARPDEAGVVRDRHHRRAARARRATRRRAGSRAARPGHARAFGEDHHPEALREPLAALRAICAARAMPRERSMAIGLISASPSRRTGSREARASARAPAAERSAGTRASPTPTGAWRGSPRGARAGCSRALDAPADAAG